MSQLKIIYKNLRLKNLLLLIIITSVLSGCAGIRLLSEYDEITDKKIAELHEKFIRHFVKLERVIGTEEANYENFVIFYDDVKVDIRILKVRANVFEENIILLESLNDLEKNTNDLQTLHKIGFNDNEEILPVRNAFDSSFSAMIKFMNALKRGNSN